MNENKKNHKPQKIYISFNIYKSDNVTLVLIGY